MHRKFIALVIGTAMAVTGLSAAPARANPDDIGKILAGLAALAVVGAIIKNKRDDRKAQVSRHVTPAPAPVDPRPLPPRVSRKVLPQHCLRRLHGKRGDQTIFGRGCLRNNYAFVNELPDRCFVKKWNNRKQRLQAGYRRKCLARHGYRIARH